MIRLPAGIVITYVPGSVIVVDSHFESLSLNVLLPVPGSLLLQ